MSSQRCQETITLARTTLHSSLRIRRNACSPKSYQVLRRGGRRKIRQRVTTQMYSGIR